jgi:hypothetical protein
MKSVIIAAVVLLIDCRTTTPTPIPVDAGTITAACANLAKLGCPEGGTSCVATIQHASSAGVTDLKPACLAAATSQDAARACGTVTCAVP